MDATSVGPSGFELIGDVELLHAISAGDRDALRSLYDRHAPWLRVRLGRRCADPEVVEEVLQDTFVAVWRKPETFQARGEVGAWLWGIAIRRLLSTLRPRRALPWERLVAPPVPSAEDIVLLDVAHGELAHAVDALTPELRAVIQAVVMDGLSSREAAQLLGVPAGTVRTRMMRARSQLREALS